MHRDETKFFSFFKVIKPLNLLEYSGYKLFIRGDCIIFQVEEIEKDFDDFFSQCLPKSSRMCPKLIHNTCFGFDGNSISIPHHLARWPNSDEIHLTSVIWMSFPHIIARGRLSKDLIANFQIYFFIRFLYIIYEIIY